jgi:hypothetical protein
MRTSARLSITSAPKMERALWGAVWRRGACEYVYSTLQGCLWRPWLVTLDPKWGRRSNRPPHMSDPQANPGYQPPSQRGRRFLRRDTLAP